jgi:hypothetical protein
MAKIRKRQIPPIGVKPEIKLSAAEAKYDQTSNLAKSAIERERAAIREKTARLREERLKGERAKADVSPAHLSPDKIARVLLRLKAKRRG